MSEPQWLLAEVVMAVHQVLIADHVGTSGSLDVGSLESALSRPQQLADCRYMYAIADLAAVYCYRLVLTASEADAVVIIEELAAGKLKEAELAAWFAD